MATSGQVILHLDLDCFYCQVEQKRLGIPRHVPAAVQQWDGLIAINYAARGLGVTRHMRVMQAMQFCPELRCIHVQTLGGETGQEGVQGPVNSGLTHPNDRLLQKACLERYRRASAEIIALIRAIVPQAPLEKASIDEVYVDVTALVEKELAERDDAATSEHAEMDAFAWGSVVEGGPLQPENEYDRRLSVGASIACRLRGAIRERLDFTCSAGIAHTKMVAKVGSARNKPDNQTIITSRGIAGLMEMLPLKKLRNFGGKLGAELEALGCTTAGQVAALPFRQLQQHFGERAKWISDCVRGLHSEPVTVRDLSKSMLAAKSFVATSDLAALERWLSILADELADRMIYDAQINQRYPRNLVLSYRQQNSGAGRRTSCGMPKAPPPGPTAALLTEAAMALLQKCPDAVPCCNLGLTATDFVDAPGDEQGCITRFFQSKPNSGRATEAAGQTEGSATGLPQGKSSSTAKASKGTIDDIFKKSVNQVIDSPSDAGQKVRQVDNAHQRSGKPEPLQQEKAGPHGKGPASYQHASADVTAARSTAQHNQQTGSSLLQSESQKVLQHQCNGGAKSAGPQDARGTGHISDNMSEGNGVKVDDSCNIVGGTASQNPLQSNSPGKEGMKSPVSRRNGEDHKAVVGQVEEGLDGIDLEEQKRILREIWVSKSMSNGSRLPQKRTSSDVAKNRSVSKQPRLTDMFNRRK